MMERVMKMGIRVYFPRLLAILAAGLIGHPALATEVYTWTDENGVLHFSDTKPTGTGSRSIEIDDAGQASYSPPAPAATNADDGGDQPLTAAQQRRRDIADARAAQQEERAITEEMCGRHRQRLEQMEPARRVYYRDENGQEVRMDDVQRIALIEESRNYIAENCN